MCVHLRARARAPARAGALRISPRVCAADLLLWGPTPSAVCLRWRGRLPPLVFWVPRDGACCCCGGGGGGGGGLRKGDGIRRRGRGTAAALAHNFVNYGRFAREPDEVAGEDVEEDVRTRGPRRVLAFAPPVVPKGCHPASGLRMVRVHSRETAVMETRLPAGFTLEAVNFRNRSPEAVARHGPNGVVERR